MTILPADKDAALFCCGGRAFDQGGRRADQQIEDTRHECDAIRNSFKGGERTSRSVHFPVAGEERSDRGRHFGYP